MSKVKDVSRYWVDKDTGGIMRTWTNEEYDLIDPHMHIFEKYWSFRCPICDFIPIPVVTKEEAIKAQTRHINRFCCVENRKIHKGFVEYRDHELICLECKFEFMEDLGMWVAKQEYYTN
jgi:hypothetical protein